MPAEAADPDRAEQLDLYKVAADEYRFQVNLNWQRTQYLLALNLGIIAAGTGLVRLGHAGEGELVLTSCIFLVGACACAFSILAQGTQRAYYRAARDRMVGIGERLRLGDDAIQTTPGMGALAKRIGKVTTYIYVLFSAIAVVDVVGFVYILHGHLDLLLLTLGSGIALASAAAVIINKRAKGRTRLRILTFVMASLLAIAGGLLAVRYDHPPFESKMTRCSSHEVAGVLRNKGHSVKTFSVNARILLRDGLRVGSQSATIDRLNPGESAEWTVIFAGLGRGDECRTTVSARN
ncbi:MAG: hypothetical protein JWP02_2558 [Acidimicrobiales bacterium]|nr:hypothetical protein [Acidimicrobiales bacterium]